MKLGVVGAGFWANYQIAGWREVDGVEVVGVFDLDLERAQRIASKFGIPAYDSLEKLYSHHSIEILDIITSVDSHAPLVREAIRRGTAVICQKPMASTLDGARQLVEEASQVNVPFFINENWRFQKPIKTAQSILASGEIGQPFRGRIQFSNSFPVFENQPFLRELEQFILTDIGSHILDVARFLFGEASSIWCRTNRIGNIRGEDVATVVMEMAGCPTVVCEMSYASRLSNEAFPQTFLTIEGSLGSIELKSGFQIYVTTSSGTQIVDSTPPSYPWADPDYDLVHSSIVAAQKAIFDDLTAGIPSGLRATENLKTVKLVFGSYDAASRDNAASQNDQ